MVAKSKECVYRLLVITCKTINFNVEILFIKSEVARIYDVKLSLTNSLAECKEKE